MTVVGDVDLVLRAGKSNFIGAIPDPDVLLGTFPQGVAEPFGRGHPIEFVVVATDGEEGTAYGNPVVPSYFEGLPILVLAFADLDGDGFVGVTLLDGDADDDRLERTELKPVGRRFAIASGGRVSGELFVEAGGPEAAPITVALAAVAWAGPADPSYFEGNLPSGPAVMTHLPFLPNTEADAILGGGKRGPPLPTSANDRVGVKVDALEKPDPTRAYGEAFTLRLDGSDPTIGVARIRAGAFERFGLAIEAVAVSNAGTVAAQAPLPVSAGIVRRGLDDQGRPASFVVPRRLSVADDGVETFEVVRIVPLDRLGNVTDLAQPERVWLQTGGTLRIVSPDEDADPFREEFVVGSAAGVRVLLDDSGGRYDEGSDDFLQIEGTGGLLRVDVSFPDPDVDDSGVVDEADATLIAAADELGLFDPSFDLDSDGVVTDADVERVKTLEGIAVSVP